MFVRTGTAMDAQAVLEIRTLAWRAAYQGLIPADFLASLDPQFGLDRLVSGLSASPSTFRLKVAESKGVILGYDQL